MFRWLLLLSLAGFVLAGDALADEPPPPGGSQSALPDEVPLSYATLVPTLLQRSLQLRGDSEDIAIARSEVEAARAESRPRLVVRTSYAFQQDNVTRGTLSSLSAANAAAAAYPTNNVLNGRLALNYPVYTGGRLQARVQQSLFGLQSEEQEFERARQQMALTAKQTYLGYLLAQETEEAARLGLMESQETLRQASARKEAGSGTRFEILQAQVAVSTRQQQVTGSHTALLTRQAEIATLFHLPVETHFAISDSLAPALTTQEEPPTRELPGLTALALGRRPELAALRARIQGEGEARKIASAGMRPEFGLSLGYGVLGSGAALYGGFSLLGELTIPLYDGGLSQARVEASDHRKLQLQVREQQQIDAIALEVKRALLELQDAETRLVTAQDAVEQAREQSRLAGVRYSLGVGTSLELVTAQSDHATARYTLAQARYEQMLALANLNFAAATPLEETP